MPLPHDRQQNRGRIPFDPNIGMREKASGISRCSKQQRYMNYEDFI